MGTQQIPHKLFGSPLRRELPLDAAALELRRHGSADSGMNRYGLHHVSLLCGESPAQIYEYWVQNSTLADKMESLFPFAAFCRKTQGIKNPGAKSAPGFADIYLAVTS